jgi:hypothetical protein
MTNKILSFFILVGICSFLTCSSNHEQKKLTKVSSNLFKTEAGWGYNILVNGKIYIHQQCIPAASSTYGFKSKEEAERVSVLVLQKIEKGKAPTIKLRELDSLKINY